MKAAVWVLPWTKSGRRLLQQQQLVGKLAAAAAAAGCLASELEAAAGTADDRFHKAVTNRS